MSASAILRWVERRALILFGVLASVWGASYMFIKIGLEHGLPAGWIVFLRTALAALALAPLALRRGTLGALRGSVPAVVTLAAMQVAAPFLLITFGERHISSSLAGILVATAPIFTFLLAFALDRRERATPLGLLGVAVGLVGVVLLLGVDTGGGLAALLGGLMVVLASLGYALGAYYLRRRFPDTEPLAVVTATMAASALLTLPFVAAELPSRAPSAGALASAVALGVLGTGIGFVIFYWLIAEVGPPRASLVAYVAPGFAVIYGVALLGESFTLATAAGLVLIVGGSWLAASAPRRELASAPRAGDLRGDAGALAPRAVHVEAPAQGLDPGREAA